MKLSSVSVYFVILLQAFALQAQKDPGVRAGPVMSGGPVAGVSTSELARFLEGKETFAEVDGVEKGLGPRFNLNSCAGCHAQPATGGSSPALNPQIAVAVQAGANNQIPAFLKPDGPVRVVRFKQSANGTPDGSVHNLFVISGRSDADPGCRIPQPDFSAVNNLSFRIPTPLFGVGLIEAIPDAALRMNLMANANQKAALGVQGRFNTSGNDGTITRFGWKAQNKSLLIFAGEAYNVEMGVTNILFPQEREDSPACTTNVTPEDGSQATEGTLTDIDLQSMFMRFLAPVPTSPDTPSTQRGSALFQQAGCAMCHTPSLQTGNTASPALRRQRVNLYSDLALHRMGPGLADGISQGVAQGQDWRTAPLWGLGDRLFLLHDGRTGDLVQAIQLHDSPGSEAHGSIEIFHALTPDQRQDLLNFLRSL